MKIINTKYNISNKLNKKIVLISDIHYYSKKDIKRLNLVLENIKKIEPNYICISGDIFDNYNVYNFDLLIEWLNKLSKISKVIMVLGNHEFYLNRKKSLYKLNKSYINEIKKINNVYFLDNKNIIFDNINFTGLNLPIEHYMNNSENTEDFKRYINNIKTENKCYNILLCHSPINISKKEIINNLNIDLALCGHTHGGLVPKFLRFIFNHYGLINPQKQLFPKNSYGHLKINNKNIIITSGIKVLSESHFKLLTNVFSSEIVEINI